MLQRALQKADRDMGRTRTFDMEDAIGTATTLFWRGYDKTSLIDLTGALGIGAASFYFAFESKEALFRKVVGRYVAGLEAAYENAFRISTTLVGVEALLRHYADVVTDPAHIPGCLVVNSSPAIHAEDAVQRWLSGHRAALRLRLEERFSTDLSEGKLPAGSNPKTMARFITTLAGGIAVEAQSGASRNDLYAMIELALQAFQFKQPPDQCS